MATFRETPKKKPAPRLKIVMFEGPPRFFRSDRILNSREMELIADRRAGKGKWRAVMEGSKVFVKKRRPL